MVRGAQALPGRIHETGSPLTSFPITGGKGLLWTRFRTSGPFVSIATLVNLALYDVLKWTCDLEDILLKKTLC